MSEQQEHPTEMQQIDPQVSAQAAEILAAEQALSLEHAAEQAAANLAESASSAQKRKREDGVDELTDNAPGSSGERRPSFKRQNIPGVAPSGTFMPVNTGPQGVQFAPVQTSNPNGNTNDLIAAGLHVQAALEQQNQAYSTGNEQIDPVFAMSNMSPTSQQLQQLQQTPPQQAPTAPVAHTPVQTQNTPIIKPQVGSEEWHRLRRDNHKEVERRRRETINEGINELAKIVPGCEKNKGSILQRAVQYITQLKESEATNIEKWTLEKLLTEQAIAELHATTEKLKAECDRAWREAETWKKACLTAGVTRPGETPANGTTNATGSGSA